jgi:hypothetical protein
MDRSGTAPFKGFYIRISSLTSHNNEFEAYISDDTLDVETFSTNIISDNTWHFVVATYDRSGDLKIYVDGQLKNNIDISSIGNIDVSKPLYFGQQDNNDNRFIGLIDEVRIYDRLLSIDEIKNLYNYIGNQPPNKPACVYNSNDDKLVVTATDPDEDLVRYGVDWDNNGVIDQWTSYVSSGTEQRIDCNNRVGSVGVIVEDEHGAQSDWVSTQHKIKSINFINNKVLIFLFERFPFLQSYFSHFIVY